MDIKFNINKIHSDLISNFSDVSIKEKSNLKFGQYFEISVINENKECRMIVTKKEIESTSFNWSYLDNPLNENSDLVERNSNIDNFISHVNDIITKERFNQDYLSQINN